MKHGLAITALGAVLFQIPASYADNELQYLISGIQRPWYERVLSVLTGRRPVRANGVEVRIEDRFTPRNMRLTRAYLTKVLGSFGFGEVVSEPFTMYSTYRGRDPRGVNFYVDLVGKTNPEKINVLNAHYDTTGRGRPGANDNGSGIAAVLSVAKAFSDLGVRPAETIRFLLVDGEERGMQGSSHHFYGARRRGEKFKVFINVDMISHSPSGLPYVCYDPAGSCQISDWVKEANRESGLNFELDRWEGFASDNLTADSEGVPNLSFFEDPRYEDGEEAGYDPRNHSKFDTMQYTNLDYATKITQLIGATTLLAAQGKEAAARVRSYSWRKPSETIRPIPVSTDLFKEAAIESVEILPDAAAAPRRRGPVGLALNCLDSILSFVGLK
jgi:Peptidase family M28